MTILTYETAKAQAEQALANLAALDQPGQENSSEPVSWTGSARIAAWSSLMMTAPIAGPVELSWTLTILTRSCRMNCAARSVAKRPTFSLPTVSGFAGIISKNGPRVKPRERNAHDKD
jgi:hypothetical protein